MPQIFTKWKRIIKFTYPVNFIRSHNQVDEFQNFPIRKWKPCFSWISQKVSIMHYRHLRFCKNSMNIAHISSLPAYWSSHKSWKQGNRFGATELVSTNSNRTILGWDLNISELIAIRQPDQRDSCKSSYSTLIVSQFLWPVRRNDNGLTAAKKKN